MNRAISDAWQGVIIRDTNKKVLEKVILSLNDATSVVECVRRDVLNAAGKDTYGDNPEYTDLGYGFSVSRTYRESSGSTYGDTQYNVSFTIQHTSDSGRTGSSFRVGIQVIGNKLYTMSGKQYEDNQHRRPKQGMPMATPKRYSPVEWAKHEMEVAVCSFFERTQ